jgi:sulfur carrier protein
MTLMVNGQTRTCPEDMTLAGLVRELGLEKSPVAVELNREVVPRGRHGDTRLREGDRLEIVTLVGGG